MPKPKANLRPGELTEGVVIFGCSDPAKPLEVTFSWERGGYLANRPRRSCSRLRRNRGQEKELGDTSATELPHATPCSKIVILIALFLFVLVLEP